MLRAGLDRSKGQGDFQVDPQLRSQGLEPPHWNLSRLHCMLGGVLRSLAPGRSPTPGLILRSEERRVGKECRVWWLSGEEVREVDSSFLGDDIQQLHSSVNISLELTLSY